MAGRIRTAVLPVARLGTRFLPATKAIPKEMLPVIDRPLIQYAVDEALAAGDEVKTHILGPGAALCSKTPDLVYLEIDGLMLAHYAVRVMRHWMPEIIPNCA